MDWLTSFKNGELAVICTTRKEAREFHKIVSEAGIRWSHRDDPAELFLYDYDDELSGGNVYLHSYSSAAEGMTYCSLEWIKTCLQKDRYRLVYFGELTVQREIKAEDILSILEA